MHSPIMAVGNGIPAIVCRFEEQTCKGIMWREIGLGDWLFDLDKAEEHKGIEQRQRESMAVVKDAVAASMHHARQAGGLARLRASREGSGNIRTKVVTMMGSMRWKTGMRCASVVLTCAVSPMAAGKALAQAGQEMPGEYRTVLSALGRTGDFKDGVLKVNLPRNDLRVTIGHRSAPTPFGFGGWVAFTKGSQGTEVLMGDLVLTEDEVNPVISAVLENGLDVTALHNHFFWEQPRIFYVHVHGMGTAAELTRRLKPAIDLIDQAAARSPKPAASTPPAAAGALDSAALARSVGHQGEQSGPVYKITIGRPDIDLREHGAAITARMGLNTWAAFAGSDTDAMVAGDVAMLEHEVTPVLKALRAHGLNIVAIHHHMTGVAPAVVFLHYFGTGTSASLAQGVRAAVDLLGKTPRSQP